MPPALLLSIVLVDFGGQDVYQHTHGVLFRDTSVFVVFAPDPRASVNPVDSVLRHCSNVAARAGDAAPILIVQSHGDTEAYEAVPLSGVKAKYGSVVNTEGVVRASGTEPGGADGVLDALVPIVLSQPHVKKAIPGSTDAVLKAIVETRRELVSRKQPPVLTLEQFVSMCVTAGVTSGSAIHLSLTLSESFGEVLVTCGVSEEDVNGILSSSSSPSPSVVGAGAGSGSSTTTPPTPARQPPSSTLVFLSLSFIGKVMSCLVSATKAAAEAVPLGFLVHSTLATIWGEYPVEWHPQLLHLLHTRLVAFEVKGPTGTPTGVSVVPAMLPRRLLPTAAGHTPSVSEVVGATPAVGRDGYLRECTMRLRLSEQPKDVWMYVVSRLGLHVDLSCVSQSSAVVSMGSSRGLVEYTEGVFTMVCRGGVVEGVRGVVSDVVEAVVSQEYPGITVSKHVKCGEEHWESVESVMEDITSGGGIPYKMGGERVTVPCSDVFAEVVTLGTLPTYIATVEREVSLARSAVAATRGDGAAWAWHLSRLVVRGCAAVTGSSGSDAPIVWVWGKDEHVPALDTKSRLVWVPVCECVGDMHALRREDCDGEVRRMGQGHSGHAGVSTEEVEVWGGWVLCVLTVLDFIASLAPDTYDTATRSRLQDVRSRVCAVTGKACESGGEWDAPCTALDARSLVGRVPMSAYLRRVSVMYSARPWWVCVSHKRALEAVGTCVCVYVCVW